VRATRPPGTASEQRLAGRRLRLAPARSSDDLLREVPGLLVVRHGAEGKGQQLFLRGFDAVHGSDVEVRVDGLPVNEVSNVHGHGYVDLAFVPPEVVRRLTVQPGPFDLQQGNFATAGSVHLSLGVAPAQRGSRLAYEAGFGPRHRLVALHAPRRSESFVVLEALDDGGYGQDRGSQRAVVLGRLADVGGRSGPTLLAGAQVGRFGSPTATRLRDWQGGRVAFGDSYVHGLQGHTARAVLAAKQRVRTRHSTWRWQAGLLGRHFELESNYTGWLYDPERGDTRRQRHAAVTGLAALQWTRRLASAEHGLRLVSGLSWQGDWLRQEDVGLALPSLQVLGASREGHGDEQHVALPVGLQWRGLPWLGVEAGARLDVLSIGFVDALADDRRRRQTLWSVSPRARLRAPLGRRVTLFGSYGRGFRSPEARAVTTADAPHEDTDLRRFGGGEPSLTLADGLEAGLQLTPGDGVRLSLAGFATFVARESVFDHVSGTNLELGPTRRLGAEVTGLLRVATWLEVDGSITAVRARFVESGASIPGAPWLLSSSTVTATHPRGLEARAGGTYIAPRPLAHGASGSHQLVLSLGVRYRVGPLQLGLDVDNLLNSAWREGEYHFASSFERSSAPSQIPVIHYVAGPPLTVRAGMSVRL